ncbi:hypothetical protein [Pyrococcus kukulkanii]|uniref:Uncharacterized protein n=1 Tax=Pyrococcus kukulkanii TaxID=1609559 RepID=A0A127B9Y1_9EURY|nr:hypothetical protein [Pyrococcus kukulkanii]AMM53486.1 hypothetical protein TQ32_02525 [Pyrococcus kukulkanii]
MRPSSSTPSFAKVILRIFILVIIVMLGYQVHAVNKPDPIRERLYELGYPDEGFIFSNNTIRWSDGHLTILEGDYIEDYPITATQAYEILRNYLADYNQKLKEHDMRIEPDPKSLSEKEEDDNYYWVFEVYVYSGSSKFFAGLAYVNRRTGAVKIKGLLD